MLDIPGTSCVHRAQYEQVTQLIEQLSCAFVRAAVDAGDEGFEQYPIHVRPPGGQHVILGRVEHGERIVALAALRSRRAGPSSKCFSRKSKSEICQPRSDHSASSSRPAASTRR
jgi:hypothetical protein